MHFDSASTERPVATASARTGSVVDVARGALGADYGIQVGERPHTTGTADSRVMRGGHKSGAAALARRLHGVVLKETWPARSTRALSGFAAVRVAVCKVVLIFMISAIVISISR